MGIIISNVRKKTTIASLITLTIWLSDLKSFASNVLTSYMKVGYMYKIIPTSNNTLQLLPENQLKLNSLALVGVFAVFT